MIRVHVSPHPLSNGMLVIQYHRMCPSRMNIPEGSLVLEHSLKVTKVPLGLYLQQGGDQVPRDQECSLQGAED